VPTQINSVDFDLAKKGGYAFKLLRNQVAEPMVEHAGGVPINTHQFSGHASSRPASHVFKDSIDLRNIEFAMS
jgi:hypothetical protein